MALETVLETMPKEKVEWLWYLDKYAILAVGVLLLLFLVIALLKAVPKIITNVSIGMIATLGIILIFQVANVAWIGINHSNVKEDWNNDVAEPYINSLEEVTAEHINQMDVTIGRNNEISINLLYTGASEVRSVEDNYHPNEKVDLTGVNLILDLGEDEDPYLTYKPLTENILGYEKGHYAHELHLPVNYDFK